MNDHQASGKRNPLCAVFGHRSREHDYSGGEYMRAELRAVDSMGIDHATLVARCPRCGDEYRAGALHLPKRDDGVPGSVNQHQLEALLVRMVDVGRRMRELQRDYFRTRSRETLIESKAAEKEFDQLLQEALGVLSRT